MNLCEFHIDIHFYIRSFLIEHQIFLDRKKIYLFICAHSYLFSSAFLEKIFNISTHFLEYIKTYSGTISNDCYNPQWFPGKVNQTLDSFLTPTSYTQWQPVPFLARVSFSNRAWPGWFLSAKRIHFKVRGFMQEATVGTKDFSICWIRGRQHVHYRYRAKIEWICIPFIRIARGLLPKKEDTADSPDIEIKTRGFGCKLQGSGCEKDMIRNHVKIQERKRERVWEISLRIFANFR